MTQFIDIKEKDSILILKLKDSKLSPSQAYDLKETLNAHLKGVKGVILDFAAADYMASIFLSALIEVMKDLNQKKIKLALAELNKYSLEILLETKLSTVFSIFASSSEAYNTLAKKIAK